MDADHKLTGLATMSTIAVIESDLAMRTLICEWLVADGHRTQARATATIGQPCQADVAIVGISDLRSGGGQTLSEVRRWCPDSAIIGLSAQLARSLPADSALVRALGVSRLIAKPCTRDEVLAAVAAAIGAAA